MRPHVQLLGSTRLTRVVLPYRELDGARYVRKL